MRTDELRTIARSMANSLRHRGPDDSGEWVDANAGIAMGHRRLAVVDLSSAGKQPMVSHSGRYVLIYNGEVYNFHELRRFLEDKGCQFHGTSDTEVLLEACAEWGVENTVKRLNGMFAFALWDRETSVLMLVRDRLGIKPIYWGQFGSLFLFGSELKAFRMHGKCKLEIDQNALTRYIYHKYVPGPSSIYENVFKLMPGHILTIRSGQRPTHSCYWDLRSIIKDTNATRLELSQTEAVDQLHDLLLDAVKRRMIADVALGAFLSGGIDSSVVVALMQAQGDKPIKTFTIGFEDQSYDEAPDAKAIATHLGTEHTELYVSPSKAIETIPRLPEWYDEPFADSSQIPTFLVSELARKEVSVALTGDGGDEVFGGYKRYLRADTYRRNLSWVPRASRSSLAQVLRLLTTCGENLLSIFPGQLTPIFGGQSLNNLERLARIINEGDEDGIYRHLATKGYDASILVSAADELDGPFVDNTIAMDIPNFMERMGYIDTVTSLPDRMLTKVDRASMAVSLEARVPLLDYRVVEFIWSLSPSTKFSTQSSKSLLRQVLYRYMPSDLIDRRKMGFGVPIQSWLRGPLREWSEELLAKHRLDADGLFNSGAVRKKWDEHISGKRNWHQLLWAVLMFQAWQKYQRETA